MLQDDLSASSTASRVDKAELQGTDVFQLRYNVGDIGANGTYVRDTISIAGATIQNQIIGAAVQSNIQLPILGLGPQAPPGVWDRRNGATYNDVVDTMMMQGVINRRAFSVFLNQASKTSGNVIFGGIDTEKYYDSLVKLSMVPTEKGTEAIVRYGLKLSQVFANGIDNVASLIEPIPALLDTGSPVIMLPAAVIDPIFKHANAITGKDGIAKVDCALARTEKATFEFTFEGKTIVVPFKDAVVDVYDERDQSSLRQSLGSQAKSWERVCFFGFRQGGPDANAILGDPFLRNAYSVFDNDDHSISLAQARFDSTKSNVVEIPANGKLPNIRGRASKSPLKSQLNIKIPQMYANLIPAPKAFDSDTNSGSKEDKKSSAQRKQASVTGAAIVAISAMMVFL